MNTTPFPPPPSRPGQHKPRTLQPDHDRLLPVLGWFADRADEIDTAFTLGWRRAALWIKATAIIGGLLAAVLLLRWIGTTALSWVHALPWPTQNITDDTGLLATIDQPVRHYLDTHTATLPVTAATAYATWQAAGAVSFVLGFFHSSGARIGWTVWGTATTAMVWIATPAPGREVAAGIAVLAWAALSLFALRGLSLTPAAFVNVDVQAPPAPPAPQVHAVIHLPTPTQPVPTSYQPYDPKQPPSLN
ncbi:hypothetical protein [Streptomyces sp. NPDC056154]|uniref:hypothetical protein n=1 Tax=unclassified Streptomyces TaxID=2593676 RepID=UPI0035D7F831